MDDIKLCIVGAGSSYTPELVEGMLQHSHEDLPVARLALMDANSERLDVMAGWTQRAIRHSGRRIDLLSGGDLARMIEGCNFVVTQIRVGGMRARHLDESIPLKYGVLGQETTGPGGMFKALRTIPAMLSIARTVEKVAPDACILNYTNPSGIITEAVSSQTRSNFIGLCSGIPGMQNRLQQLAGDRFPGLVSYCVGLNHLGFIHRILSRGVDVTREAIDHLASSAGQNGNDNADMAQMKLASLIGAIPIGYVQYYLHRAERLKHVMKAPQTRAEAVMEIERNVFQEAANPAIHAKPMALKKRGGGGYSGITFAFMRAVHFSMGEELVCSSLNRGSVDGIPDDAAIEVVCKVNRDGATPVRVGEIPLAFRGLVQAVKAYESLTVKAAITGEKRYVLQALLNHPLVGDIDVVGPLVDEMCAAHGLTLA